MVTPLTYEGLIDEIVGIENCRIKVDSSVIGDDKDDSTPAGLTGPGLGTTNKQAQADKRKPPVDTGPVVVHLNSSDAVFGEVRDISIEKLGFIFQDKAINIKERYSSFRENKDASISEIHDFVKKIPTLTKEFKQVQKHINIAEVIKLTTDSREFRDLWQCERGLLEGEMFLDQIEVRRPQYFLFFLFLIICCIIGDLYCFELGWTFRT